MKIGILGDNKSVLAFGALGVETFGVSNKEELLLQIKAIKEKDLAILLINEDIAQNFDKEISNLFQETLPACLVIPGINKDSGKAKEGLKKILERALGSESFIN
ncbi:MAG: V-type ATP synthase subunit F [Candidatus Pacebacteria bacterium]|nr:V-type ATP synthase subunit F [Candidatus Paceibacterota bacterium]